MNENHAGLLKLARLRAQANEARAELEKVAWLLHVDSPYRRDSFERAEAEKAKIEHLGTLAETLVAIREAESGIGSDLDGIDVAFRRLIDEATAP